MIELVNVIHHTNRCNALLNQRKFICSQVKESDKLGPSESSFYRVWNDRFKHVKTPTHTPFAACDICFEMKENILLASNPQAVATHRGDLKKHRVFIGDCRGVYGAAK